MSATVADFLVTRLSEWGVKRLFGYPGERSRATNSNFLQVRQGITPAMVRLTEKRGQSGRLST